MNNVVLKDDLSKVAITGDYNDLNNKPIPRSKFEELDDVDVVNKKDKQVVVFSGDTNKFTTIDLSAMGEAAGLSLSQVNKMGTTGTSTTPAVIDIPITTIDFKVPKINVLKFQTGDQNVIKSENTFNSGDSNFVSDEMVVFDGTAHLKTDFSTTMSNESDIDNYKSYSVILDKTNFKNINSLSIADSGTDKVLNVNATPLDRLLVPLNDLNLSNVDNIDYFNLMATGGNIRIICSVDSGVTWKTFDGTQWVNIIPTVEAVKANGMSKDVFNSISSEAWNYITIANKIRFAYLLQDDNSIDELKLQYDASGYWVEAKETTYDIIYASNSLLQVKLYFDGDVKINY